MLLLQATTCRMILVGTGIEEMVCRGQALAGGKQLNHTQTRATLRSMQYSCRIAMKIKLSFAYKERTWNSPSHNGHLPNEIEQIYNY